MRFFSGLLIGFVALAVTLIAAADEHVAQDQAIVTIIEDQLAAFQRDDGAAAFAFASPKIQRMFGNPDRFMRMVRNGYQPVYRPREVEFLGLIDEAGQLVQRVRLVGPSGEPVIAHYYMTRLADGSWRIDGCILKQIPSENV